VTVGASDYLCALPHTHDAQGNIDGSNHLLQSESGRGIHVPGDRCCFRGAGSALLSIRITLAGSLSNSTASKGKVRVRRRHGRCTMRTTLRSYEAAVLARKAPELALRRPTRRPTTRAGPVQQAQGPPPIFEPGAAARERGGALEGGGAGESRSSSLAGVLGFGQGYAAAPPAAGAGNSSLRGSSFPGTPPPTLPHRTPHTSPPPRRSRLKPRTHHHSRARPPAPKSKPCIFGLPSVLPSWISPARNTLLYPTLRFLCLLSL
jgi:hypothetical protein